MELKTYFAQDASGNIMPGAQVFVYLAGTTTLASGIVDQNGAPLTNPFNADSSAAVVFAAPDGEYDVKCSGASRTVTIRAKLFDGGAFKAELAATGGSALVGADDGASGSLWTTVAGFIAFLLSSLGSSVIGFIQSGVGAIWRSVMDKLRETVSVADYMTDAQRADILTGTPTLDIAPAIQAAINAAGQNANLIYPDGVYRIATSTTALPQQRHTYRGCVFKVDAGVQMYVRGTDGYPGRIEFDGIARFEGAGQTGRAISLTNNAPFVRVGDMLYFEGFDIPVLLNGSYGSYVGGIYVGNKFGPHLLNECHDTVVNAKSDLNTESGVCVNGNPVSGNLGANPIHNVTIRGCYQKTKHGIWLENCYETRLENIYHEGNTHSDVKLGVADGGVYGRSAYHTVVDGWQSSSPCASGRNWDIEHSVAAHMVGLAFNAGTSTTATVFQVDGFSDQIDVDYQRVQHASIGATAPFNVPAGRVIIRNNGASLFPWAKKFIEFGSTSGRVGALWGTFTGGGRATLQLECLGAGHDLTIKVQEIERHESAAGASGLQIDHLNARVEAGYITRPATDNTLAIGEASRRWSVVYAGTGTINTSDEREKQQIRELSDAERAVAVRLKSGIRAFKFNDAVAAKGDGARIHVGVIAQDVKAAFEAEGLDALAYAVLCFDEWAAEFGEDGNEIHPAGERYGVRYEELLAFIIAAL